MKIKLIGFPKKGKTLICFFFLLNTFVYSQCTTANFTVTKINGTCFSNASITVNVAASTDCSAWVAVITRPSDNFSTQLNIPTSGGSVTFSSLPPGNYNVSLSNGFSTINYAANPVVISTSYVNMSISATSNPPTCQNSAPGYTPNGTLTINVANGTGIGPFVYTLTASNGTQTATSSNRVYTFLNVPGGEVVNISVTDQAGGTPGCSVTSTQSPTTATNTSAIMAFDTRPFNYERDCSNPTSSCNNVNLFVNIKNLNAAKLAVVQQPGNATITIAGSTYNLTYLSGSARFKYNPVSTGGPQLVNGTVITTTFFDGCNTISKTSTVAMNDNFLTANPTTITNTSNCTVSYRIQLLGDQDVSGGNGYVDRAVYFCQQNSITFERRISTSPDVWQMVPSNEITPDPSASTNPLGVNIGIPIPSAGTNYFLTQSGVYRITASDACHTVVRTITVAPTNPFTNVTAVQTTSVLEGTSAIKVNFSGLPPLTSPVKVKITRVDGQSTITINPTQPAYLAGTYTVNFPIERNISYPVNATFIQDLPLGQYIVELSDGCSTSTGFTKTINVNLTNAVSYNPQFSVTTGCIGSNSISYNMNPTYSPNSDNQVRLYTANSNGSVGTYLQISSSSSLSGTFTNLNSGNYFVQFGNIKAEALGGGVYYSAAMNNIGPWQYLVPITIQPYQDIAVATVTSFCDIGNTNSGIILTQVAGGNIVYPITFQLFSVSNPSTPIQTVTFQSLVDSAAFQNVAVGNYFVRVTTACYSVDTNVTLSTSGTVPQAEVSSPVICPGSPTTVAIIAASQNLFDVTWTVNGQVVGTGMPIILSPTVTTTYTATYTLKSIYGCSNSPVYTSNVTVTVTPNPNLGLAVSDINLCDGSLPRVTISNTQSEYTYEIVNSNGTSFSPPLLANGNGGSLTIAIPNSITLTAGQVLKVKSTNGNAGCTGLLTDVCNIVSGTFNITCPTFPSASVQCYADLPSQTSYTISQFQALGNGNGIVDVVGCGVIEITAINGPNPGCNANAIRTYTITEYADPNNNDIRDLGENTILKTTSCSQTIHINDTTAPVVTGTLTALTVSGCSVSDAPTAMTTVSALESAGLTITDNCTIDSNLVVTSVDGTASGTCPITFTRTYTITDVCGNATTATQTINISDTTAPVVTGTLTALTASGCSVSDAPTAMTTVSALESAGLTITDNCTIDSNLVVTSVDGTASGTCPITFTRTYTITDVCGNATTAIQTINVSDTTAPVVQTTIGSLNVSLECSNTSGLTAALGLIPTAIDNCTSPILHLVSDITTVDAICSNAYVRVRTWNFTDACGNTSTSFVQTITVQDTTAPVFLGTLPQDLTLECNQVIPVSVSLTATDSCGGSVTVSFSEQTVAGSCANNYTLFRTWTATDVCGNFSTHIQEINVQDTTPPVFVETLPAAEIYAKCDGIPVAPVLTATDNCGAVTVNYSEVRIDGDCTNKYRLERTWTAIDACGNQTEFNQTVYLACYVTPYNALSPDGDGLNDTFIIEGLECFPNNSVEIFNRWGVKIFEASFYDNVNTVFRGLSDGRITISRNDKLPTGTYYYILKYEYDLYGREKENIEKTGHIYIQNE